MVLDALLGNSHQVLTSVRIALLLAASGLLLYPVVAYAQNVAYTEGFVGLAMGLFLLTVSNVVGVLIDYGVVLHTLESSEVVRAVTNLAASLCATVGTYYFARQFIDTSAGEFSTEETTATGGFEDAGED
jgi:hypothetical protein